MLAIVIIGWFSQRYVQLLKVGFASFSFGPSRSSWWYGVVIAPALLFAYADYACYLVDLSLSAGYQRHAVTVAVIHLLVFFNPLGVRLLCGVCTFGFGNPVVAVSGGNLKVCYRIDEDGGRRGVQHIGSGRIVIYKYM